MKKLCTLLLLFAGMHTYAQREYLLTIDPATGKVRYNTFLPDVHYISTPSTIDDSNHVYTFSGIDFNFDRKLYSVDIKNGAPLYNPAMPVSLALVQYNNSNHKLYGVTLSPDKLLLEIDPVSGSTTTVNTLGDLGGITSNPSCSNHVLYFAGLDNIFFDKKIFKVNTLTGAVQTIPQTISSVDGLTYHDSSGYLYCILSAANIMSLIRIDTASGASTTLYGPISGHSFGSATIDQHKNQYIMTTCADNITSTGNCQIFIFNLPNGTLADTVSMPVFPTIQDNLLHIAHDKNLDKFFMLHWESDTTILNCNTFPAPYVTGQPQDDTVSVAENTFFDVVTAGFGTAIYQWQEDAGSGFSDLSDNSQYSGVHTDSLHISNIPASFDNNRYRCVITSSTSVCGDTSIAALLLVDHPTKVSGMGPGRLAVYPNPTGDIVSVSASFTISSVEVTDIWGRVISKISTPADVVRVSLADRPSGMYLIRVNNTLVEKVWKQ